MSAKPAFEHCWRSAKLKILAAIAMALASPLHAAPPLEAAAPVAERSDAGAIEQLKRDYLLCNWAAIDGRLNSAAIMQCSVIYEQLKQLAFDGDFGRLYAWSKENPVQR